MNLFFSEEVLFDSHTHLTSPKFDVDRDSLVESAVKAGVQKIIDVGIDLDSSKKAIQSAIKYDGVVFASVGIDPQVLVPGHSEYEGEFLNSEFRNTGSQELRDLINKNLSLVKAIGETGIDLFYLSAALAKGEISHKDVDESTIAQQQLFRLHLEIADEFGLPVTIHSRGAEQQCARIVSEYPNVKGVFHSYTGNIQVAKSILDLGWGLGVNGIVTFKNSIDLRNLYSQVLGKVSSDWSPQDFYKRGIYFETDAPYLSPEGKRGERNTPENVLDIYNFMTSSLN